MPANPLGAPSYRVIPPIFRDSCCSAQNRRGQELGTGARTELDHKYGIDYKRHIRDLQVIRDRALENGAYSAAVQAEYRRGQAHGDIYINKSEIRHGSIDSMSKEDVLKALNEIKDGYAQNTIDVTPEREADSGDIPEQGERVVEDDEVSLGEEPEEV
jgi:hypothetical protein